MELLGIDTNKTVFNCGTLIVVLVTAMNMNTDVEGNPQAEVLG